MKITRFELLFGLTLFISACTTNQMGEDKKVKNRTKLKGDFIFKNKTIKNDLLKVDSTNEQGSSNKKQKTNINYKTKTNTPELTDFESKKAEVKNEKPNNNPVLIPEKWSKAYSNDPKWMEFYEQTSNAFLTGWTNEFENNPSSKISKEELLFAYRRRMEKIFYETPSFIEFSVFELNKSEKFKTFLSSFQSNVK